MTRLHLWLAVMWGTMMPLSIATGWIYSIAFIAVCSIYANFVGHWSAYQAAKGEENSPDA